MKKLLTPLLLVFSMFLTSCGDSPESVAEDLLGKMEEMTGILKDLNEGGDIEDAKADLEDLKEEMKELADKMKEMEKDMSDEDKKALEEKYKDKMETVMKDFMGEGMKLAAKGNEEIGKMLQDIFKDME